MKGRDVLFSSASTDWATPPEVFEPLDKEFRFTLDPCATAENAKCVRFYTAAEDGLQQPWAPHRVFMNPPYGREIRQWMAKAAEENTKGALVVCLIHARTDTRWWHDCVEGKAAEVRFLRGRVRFLGAPNTCPFPSVVVVYRPGFAWLNGGRLAFAPIRRGNLA